MKLIKRGIPKDQIIKKQSCRNCNSEFEFTMSDKEIKRGRGDISFVLCVSQKSTSRNKP